MRLSRCNAAVLLLLYTIDNYTDYSVKPFNTDMQVHYNLHSLEYLKMSLITATKQNIESMLNNFLL